MEVMRSKWDKYLKENASGKADCRLVAVLNAYTFLLEQAVLLSGRR